MEYKVFNLSRDSACSCDQRVFWLYQWNSHTVSHNPAKIGGHGSCKSGDKTSLICGITSHGHMTKEEVGPLPQVNTLPSLMTINLVNVEI